MGRQYKELHLLLGFENFMLFDLMRAPADAHHLLPLDEEGQAEAVEAA